MDSKEGGSVPHVETMVSYNLAWISGLSASSTRAVVNALAVVSCPARKKIHNDIS